jgi:hypothetical protein
LLENRTKLKSVYLFYENYLETNVSAASTYVSSTDNECTEIKISVLFQIRLSSVTDMTFNYLLLFKHIYVGRNSSKCNDKLNVSHCYKIKKSLKCTDVKVLLL